LNRNGINFDRRTLTKIINTFEETGCVEVDIKYYRNNTVRTPEAIANVKELVVEAEENAESVFVTQIRRATNLTDRTIRRILHEDLCLNPYHPISVQALSEDDFQSRTDFAYIYTAITHQERDFPNRIIYSDESAFHVNGQVNRHNCVYWSRNNPQRTFPVSSIGPRVMVWAGIWSGGRVGPVFIEGHLNGHTYEELLEQVWPQIRDAVENNQLYFQQDKLSFFL